MGFLTVIRSNRPLVLVQRATGWWKISVRALSAATVGGVYYWSRLGEVYTSGHKLCLAVYLIGYWPHWSTNSGRMLYICSTLVRLASSEGEVFPSMLVSFSKENSAL